MSIQTLNAYEEFKERFKLFISKNPDIIINTLSNIFSMRIIGNKTHGDLAEIGLSEFINQFMYDYESKHVGKDLFRSKTHEEDILVTSIIGEQKGIDIPISLKAYGDGPLQLSTDKEQILFPFLKQFGKDISDQKTINSILSSDEFLSAYSINVMPLIYDETMHRCNIMVFDFKKAYKNTARILLVDKNEKFDKNSGTIVQGKGRSHPIYLFVDHNGEYICEIRYGGASANALQRGFWTHTKNAISYFDSLTSGWIDYSLNQTLVQLFSIALNATKTGHEKAKEILQDNINNIKNNHGI